MIKINSIAYQSISEPNRMALYSSVLPDLNSAISAGIAQLIREHGDFSWKPILQTSIEVNTDSVIPSPIISPVSPPSEEEKLKRENKHSSSWLLKKIIENKDKILLSASIKYLTESELLFIQDKLYESENNTV